MASLKFSISLAVVAVLGPLLVSYIMGGWVSVYTSHGFSADDIPRLDGKVAIVTGANTGIGKITVRELARKGARVVLSSRDEAKGEVARKEICQDIGKDDPECGVDVMRLDLASLESVLSFTDRIKTRFDHIDILILNAGIMFGEFSLTKEGYERQWGTNHLGHFFLVERLINLLTDSRARVVTVSSSAHKGPYWEGIAFDQLDNDKNYNPFLAYGQSKLANILFANELSDRYSSFGLTSNSLHPGNNFGVHVFQVFEELLIGVIKTELMRHFNANVEHYAPKLLLDLFLEIENAAYNVLFMSPEQGALTQLYVATSPSLSGVTGKFFKPVGVFTSPSSHAQNTTMQRKLWDISSNITADFLKKRD